MLQSERFANIIEGENVSVCAGIDDLPSDGLGCDQIVGFTVLPGRLAG